MESTEPARDSRLRREDQCHDPELVAAHPASKKEPGTGGTATSSYRSELRSGPSTEPVSDYGATRRVRLFESLSNRNFRLFFLGQSVSFTGTWMQAVAQAWLVLQLTGSGTAVGGVFAVQFFPMMIVAPYAGVVADRLDKRWLLQVVQAVAAVAALSMGVLTALGLAGVWVVYGLALALGAAQAFDNPVRQSFIAEMVGTEKATNAVSLNTVMVNTTRIAGPAIAGFLLARVGAAACFVVNGLSYLAAFAAYAAMRQEELVRSEKVKPRKGQLREALRYVAATPDLAIPLGTMALVGTLAFNFQVVMPVFVQETFGRGPESLGLLVAFAGVGSMVGGLAVATSTRPARSHLVLASAAMGVFLLVFALAPSFRMAGFLAPALGAGAAAFIALSNATLQVNSDPQMRGRVLSLFSVAFLGSTPVGGPLVGWLAERFGARAALVVGATACGMAAVSAAMAYRLWASRSKEALQSPRCSS